MMYANPDTVARARRWRGWFLLSVLAMVGVALPPLLMIAIVLAIIKLRRQLARDAAARPTYRQDMIARGRVDL